MFLPKRTLKIAKFQHFLRFFRGYGNDFHGIFCNAYLGHIFRKLDIKFGGPMMPETSSNRVTCVRIFVR